MSANRIVTCFCWAPDVSGPAGGGFLSACLERGAAIGAEPGVRPVCGRTRTTYLLDFCAALIAVLPLQRAFSTAGAGYEHLSSRRIGNITGRDCRSHAGKRGRPPARSVATRRKRSGSRSAAVCRPARSRAGDDRLARACDRSGHRPGFPSSRIWIGMHGACQAEDALGLRPDGAAHLVGQRDRGGNVRHHPVRTDEADDLRVWRLTGRAGTNLLLGHLRLHPCISTERSNRSRFTTSGASTAPCPTSQIRIGEAEQGWERLGLGRRIRPGRPIGLRGPIRLRLVLVCPLFGDMLMVTTLDIADWRARCATTVA